MKRTIATVAIIATLHLPAPSVEAATGRCRQYEPALAYAAGWTGWSVPKMSYIMWRESRCLPYVEAHRVVNGQNQYAVGLLQPHTSSFQYLSRKFGVPVWKMRTWLKQPHNNIAAAAALYTFWKRAGYSGYRPWRVW